jgi:hypothetical protein
MGTLSLSIALISILGMLIPQQERWVTAIFFMFFLVNFFYGLPALLALFG